MRHLNIYESFNPTLEEKCKEYEMFSLMGNYSINEDDTVDANFFTMPMKAYGKIPIKFNRIKGNFICKERQLRTLENSPKYVGNIFDCSGNKQLTTLLNGPNYVRGAYKCNDCNLSDVYGFPEAFEGILIIVNNPINVILSYAHRDQDKGNEFHIRKIKFIRSLNEHQVIRNGNTVVRDRLDEALYDIGIKMWDWIESKNYKLI